MKTLNAQQSFFGPLTAVLLSGLLASTVVSAAPPSGVFPARRGVFALSNTDRPANNNVLNNPDVAGISVRYSWAELEPTEGTFDWEFIDSEIARAVAADKKVMLRIGTQDNKPAWVTDAIKNANGTFFTFDDAGVTTTIPVFWDPTYLAKKKAMIAALGARYTNNPNLAIVAASFANKSSEDWAVPHTQVDVANWLAAGYTSAKLLDAGKQLIDATMVAFPHQRVALAIGANGHVGAPGINLDPTADYVARNAIASARASWPRRLVAQINSLSALTEAAPGEEDSIRRLIWDSQPEVAAQMLMRTLNDEGWRMNGGIPGDPAVILTKAVDTGAGYGMKYMEIYQTDVIGLPEVISYARAQMTKK